MALVITAENEGGKAQIKIIGAICNWRNSAEDFEYHIDQLRKDGVTDVELYINTSGGSVFEAAEISNIIQSFGGVINGKGGAIVASAGTYIASKCNRFELSSNTQYMIHKPHAVFQGNEDKIKSDLKLLENMTTDYIKTYADKTGMTEDAIRELITGGDYWMNATEAVEKGFVDSVAGEAVIDAETMLMIEASSSPNKVRITQQKKESTMEFNPVILGLNADASDAEITARITELKAFEDKILLAQANEAAAKVSKLIADAVKDKKIPVRLVATYTKMATDDFATTQQILDSIPSATTPLSQQLGDTPKLDTLLARKDWKYADWAEKDPKGLTKMMDDDSARFAALSESYFE